MNEFLGLVTERHDEKLVGKEIFCPFCGSEEVQTFGTRSTLVGYLGVDRNHTWTECRCIKCQKEFTWETKGFDRVWVTDPNNKVLMGIPWCFEGYVYTCKHCGGDVVRVYFDAKTDEPLKPFEINGKPSGYVISYEMKDGVNTPRQYPVFKCKNCGEKIKSENEYYRENGI